MKNEIILGDCLEIMNKIESNSINLVLCDLPYGVTSQNKWDVIIPFAPLWEQYNRIIKDNGAMIFTATEPFASMLISSNIKDFRYDLIWVKNKSTGFLNSKKMPLRAHERILVFYKSLPTYNPQKTTGHKPANSYTKHTSDRTNYGKTKLGISGGGQTDRYPTSVIKINVHNNDSKDKYHPTQKPVELMEYLIKTYTNKGDIVLDNCCGSGSTLIAAKILERQFIGIEKEENYYNVCLERMSKLL